MARRTKQDSLSMIGSWEIFRYPLSSTRIDGEFYDEFTCEKEIAEEVAIALRKTTDEWWYYVKDKSEINLNKSWEDTGKFMSVEPEPTDELYLKLKNYIN